MEKNIDVLNAEEAAAFLGAHVETIRRLARKGDIPAFKIGKDWRFRREELLKWASEHYLRSKAPCVLVVDDEQVVRDSIAINLETDCYRILKAAGGAEGLAWLESEVVDLILLDLQMPNMNGPQFLQRLKEAGINIPVIIITAYPDSDLMAEAMRFGPITLLAKPFGRDMLRQAIRNTLLGVRDT